MRNICEARQCKHNKLRCACTYYSSLLAQWLVRKANSGSYSVAEPPGAEGSTLAALRELV